MATVGVFYIYSFTIKLRLNGLFSVRVLFIFIGFNTCFYTVALLWASSEIVIIIRKVSVIIIIIRKVSYNIIITVVWKGLEFTMTLSSSFISEHLCLLLSYYFNRHFNIFSKFFFTILSIFKNVINITCFWLWIARRHLYIYFACTP